jgi:O-antigen/teichoic acid export membrane protein
MHDLKAKAVRAGIINVGARGFGFVVRVLSIIILGRLLDPRDYGVVTMVTAFTGVLNMFGALGLSQAAIQRDVLTEDESASLFWINLAFGGLLTLITIASAPLIAWFYHEPRLLAVTEVVGITFIIAGAGIQHGALLRRRMLFGLVAAIDTVALLVGTAVSIGMATAGYTYWALVSTTITIPLVTTFGLWISTGWIPGRPQIAPSIKPLLRFGLGSTMNGFISYFASNVDKLLIGRVWGIEAVGLYGRAYNLINFPGDNLNTTIGEVAFAALSRTRSDPVRFKRYFLKGYSLVVTLTLPLTIVCALFSNDLVAVVLGPKWAAAAPIFRILAPTILAFAILNPLGWLLNSLGLIKRGVYIASLFASIVTVAVLIGLPYGPTGVAVAYSTATVIKVIPITAWAVRGTGVRMREIFASLWRPLAASAAATAAAIATYGVYGSEQPIALRLVTEIGLFGVVYVTTMLLLAGQQALCLDLFRAAKTAPHV